MSRQWIWLPAILLVLSTGAARAASLEIIEYACARQIVERQPIEVVDCANFQLPSPAYLWVRLRGDAAALAELAAGGAIVIRHKWIRYVGPRVQIDTIAAQEDLPGGKIDPAYLDRLHQEVAARGYFDWRTWTEKTNLRTTAYSIDVIDQAFDSIPCAENGGAAACQIEIHIEGAR